MDIGNKTWYVSGIEAKFCFDLSGEFFFYRIVLLYSHHLGQGAHSLGLLVFSESLDSGQGKFFVGINLNMVPEILPSWNFIRYQESCGHRAPGLLSLPAPAGGRRESRGLWLYTCLSCGPPHQVWGLLGV